MSGYFGLQQHLPTLLAVYGGLLFFFAFVLRTLVHWYRYRVWPLRGHQPSPGLVWGGYGLRAIVALMAAAITLRNMGPSAYRYALPWIGLEGLLTQLPGALLLLAGFLLVVLGQYQMKSSWRIGVDTHTPTELVEQGLYRYSRNPIYVGIAAVCFGMLLVLPSLLTLGSLLLALSTLPAVVREEERFLTQQHGESFRSYCKRVPRWL